MRKSREIRLPETEAKYREYLAREQKGCPFCLDVADATTIRKYQHWYIRENRFPYDNIYSVSHLLVPVRHVEHIWDWTEGELAEYLAIRRELAEAKSYDELLENFPVARTQIHFHLHLLGY